MNIHIYKNFLVSKDIYRKNVKYWDDIIKNLLIPEKFDFVEYLSTNDGFGNNFCDGNPIYNFKVDRLNKGVRIIQEEPETNNNILFSAWINELELETNEKIDELVISLELTQETTFLAIDLINAWILRDLTKHRMKNYIKTVAGLRNIITEQYNLETA
jgi:ribosome-associated translation inhibitor RaiA